MDDAILYLTATVCLIAVAVATAIIAVRRDGRYAGELIQQFVIWAGIATLLPLTSWAGATLLHPRTKLQNFTAKNRVCATSATRPIKTICPKLKRLARLGSLNAK